MYPGTAGIAAGYQRIAEVMIIEINGEYYDMKYRDPGIMRPEDKGLWRSFKVKKDFNGKWYTCDDYDYLINDVGIIVARESGWDLQRENL